jgi:hypothetical protein
MDITVMGFIPSYFVLGFVPQRVHLLERAFGGIQGQYTYFYTAKGFWMR